MSHKGGWADMVVVLTERCNRHQETGFQVRRRPVVHVRLLVGGTLGAPEVSRKLKRLFNPPIYENLIGTSSFVHLGASATSSPSSSNMASHLNGVANPAHMLKSLWLFGLFLHNEPHRACAVVNLCGTYLANQNEPKVPPFWSGVVTFK